MSNSSSHDLNSIFSVLTPKIQADLPAWYGKDAKLSGAPTFHPRDWSFFFYYPIQVSDTETKTILVKIRHAENMSLAEAVVSPKMKEEVRGEYETLVKIRDVFSKQDEPSMFATIRPLACYDEINAVVEEMADLRTLRSHFQAPGMWVDGEPRKIFETHMNTVGRWLRIFHDQLGVRQEGPFFSEALYKDVQEHLDRIEASASHPDAVFVRELILALYKKYRGVKLPHRTLHNDFNSANIFVTNDGRICSFDSHNIPGPMYVDLAKIMTDLETCRVQVLSGGLAVPRPSLGIFNASLLKGYFGENSADHIALNFFRLVMLIERWKDSEETFEKVSGTGKFVNSIAMIQLRRYYRNLLRRQAKQGYGL